MVPQTGYTEEPESFGELVNRSLSGDQQAWRTMCDRLKGVAWKAIYGVGLPRADAEDAFASTFFRLAEHLGRIREPEKLPGWIATTARNEARAVLRSQRRVQPSDTIGEQPSLASTAEERVIDDELRADVRQAFGQLRELCRDLLRLLTAVPKIPYDVISVELGIPVGSIGPTRARCLNDLRKFLGVDV